RFARAHQSLRVTPSMMPRVSNRHWRVECIAGLPDGLKVVVFPTCGGARCRRERYSAMPTDKTVRSMLPSRRSHVLIVGTYCLLSFVATANAAEPLRLSADMAQGRALWDEACQAEANCSAECVDLYYRCAVLAYAHLASNPQD